MGKETRDRLIHWLKDTVETQYRGKIALVCLYGSHINGTANQRSDVDCYFVPKTAEGLALARTFLLEGVGYDIFPMNWQRLEDIAALRTSHQPLVGDVQVLYADAPEDVARLEGLQRQMQDNLSKPAFRKPAAEGRWLRGRAGAKLPGADWTLRDSRMHAGGLLMDLAEKLAFSRGVYYHYGLKRQFTDLLALEDMPPELESRYLAVLQASHPAAIREACRQLMVCCGCYVEEAQTPIRWAEMPKGAELAGLYEEISSTFRKIEACADQNDPVLAFLSAVCLQWELPEMDILTDYRFEDLPGFAQKTAEKELVLRQMIAESGGVLKEYPTFEAFLQAQTR